ncbi:hypothetical protein HQ533_03650 [Candidatus Woesearchaeota archaeon]|nr:hypothetical protein [Candidatus Woesearchaeota archaeon]
MTVYCVGYDLKKDRDYKKLFEKIKTYNSCHALESMWFIESDKDVGAIRDDLKTVIDSDDAVIVIEVVEHWATRKVITGTTDWLKREL